MVGKAVAQKCCLQLLMVDCHVNVQMHMTDREVLAAGWPPNMQSSVLQVSATTPCKRCVLFLVKGMLDYVSASATAQCIWY